MQTIVTLAAPEGGLSAVQADGLARSLDADGVTWLAPATACDLAVDTAPEPARLRALLKGLPVDFAVQPAENRRKRLLLADMDSTIVASETLDEMATRAGIGEKIAAITARAMNGELDFKAALRERVGMLAGLDAAIIADTLAHVALSAGASVLVRTLAKHGVYTALVSGGFTEFTAAMRARAGFHVDRANRLEIKNGRLTGRVVEPILDKDAKLAALQELTAARGLSLADALTVGDGANDLPMILAAQKVGGLGVAYRAKPSVRTQARVTIRHTNLMSLLYFQGYRREEFAV